jgi:unsaturated rhamnogalacturonyl hydrolase
MMAKMDVLDYLPEDHPQRPELIRILNSVAKSLLQYRDEETGVWYQVLDKSGRAGNYPEASCTAMYAYVFAKGAQQGSLTEEYRKIAQSVFDDMVAEFVDTDAHGEIVIKNTRGSYGLGGIPYLDGSYEYYIT